MDEEKVLKGRNVMAEEELMVSTVEMNEVHVSIKKNTEN